MLKNIRFYLFCINNLSMFVIVINTQKHSINYLTIIIMKTLTQSDVNAMSKAERQAVLDRLEDLMCNTDYLSTKGGILYDMYAKSARMIENKQFGEY
jgi:hypothetical protein